MVDLGFICPHPPLIIPDIGNGREKIIKETVKSYDEVGKLINRYEPDTIIIISSHAPFYRDCFFVLNKEEVEGDLKRFGSSFEKKIKIDQEMVSRLYSAYPRLVNDLGYTIDHGTMVPLYFLTKHKVNANYIIIGQSGLSLDEHFHLGKVIKKVARDLKRRVVVIGSGDTSHALKKDGPYGFSEAGPIYEKKLISSILSNDHLTNFNLAFLDQAKECGHRSFVITRGAMEDDFAPLIMSHQFNFGVGYLVAGYKRKDYPVKLAKKALTYYLETGRLLDTKDKVPEYLNTPKGVFVSIYKDNDLRGCIGTIFPVYKNAYEEIIHNVVSAALHDDRFKPVEYNELDSLHYSVDLLGDIEKVNDRSLLDSDTYGIIVTSIDDSKRGVLLPRIKTINNISDQIRIATLKAGLNENDPIKIYRFKVDRYEELFKT